MFQAAVVYTPSQGRPPASVVCRGRGRADQLTISHETRRVLGGEIGVVVRHRAREDAREPCRGRMSRTPARRPINQAAAAGGCRKFGAEELGRTLLGLVGGEGDRARHYQSES
jgi:hypothetical protein